MRNYSDYMDKAICTGSVVIFESEKDAFADYLLRRGCRSRFFFCEPVDGLVEVLY